MKKTKAHRGLHLLTAEEAASHRRQASTNAVPEPTPDSQPEMDKLIANGVRRYQQLRQELDRELFGDQDQEKLLALMSEKHLLQDRLKHYGVRVGP